MTMIRPYLLCLTLLLTLLMPAAEATAQAATIMCPTRSPLVRTATITQPTTCFTVTPTKGSTALRLDLLVTSGVYDLYVKSGSVSSLGGADKANVAAIRGALNYVLVNPGVGPYTVAVVRSGAAGAAQLSPVTTYGARFTCSGATCTALYPLTSMPGAKAGDQVIFPVNIARPGRVDAKATWKSTARLAATLYGPSVSGAQVSRATKSGATPLALTYAVKTTDLVRDRMWSLALVNAGGAVPGGEVSITYPQ